ncbi:hypothetical protein H4219_003425 [Mycoemilia scoparia]|uniref:Uncharacterized protein n=1 Tax=Mycoemilia scoparia TaxID=417184 RepID=A0A9W8A036_9FUNG|nr:hypothetical protein H4219_003425 [Mycoemilia scoparia]
MPFTKVIHQPYWGSNSGSFININGHYTNPEDFSGDHVSSEDREGNSFNQDFGTGCDKELSEVDFSSALTTKHTFIYNFYLGPKDGDNECVAFISGTALPQGGDYVEDSISKFMPS